MANSTNSNSKSSPYSSEKIFYHPEKIASFLERKVTAPIHVRVKPTNKCNHSCYYCAYDTQNPNVLEGGRRDRIPKEKMMELLDDFKEIGVKAITYSGGGEPLIYPYMTEALRKTLKYNIDFAVITNGQGIEGKMADLLSNAKWIRVSMDSCNPKMFSETRRRPEFMFNELIKNVENFAKIKKKCTLGINFVIQEKNFDKVYESIKLFKELGADHIKLAPRHIPEGSLQYHSAFKETVAEQIAKAKKDFPGPGFEIYDDYEKGIQLSQKNNREYSKCYMMQTTPAIGANQMVYYCHDKAWIGKENGVLGSVKGQSFKKLWFSDETARIFKEFNPAEGCKHHCTNDEKNIVIRDYIKDLKDSFSEAMVF